MTTSTTTSPTTAQITFRNPAVEDGATMWRLARDSGSLDLNTSYAYLLFARDFAQTCRIVEVDGEPAGFVLGYRRQSEPGTLFVWQIAVAAEHRGRQLGLRLLDDVATEATYVEATITADNTASQRLFTSFARSRGSELNRREMFTTEDFPDGHEAEGLVRIGPMRTNANETETRPMSTVELESQVRSYSRSWPTSFDRASGATIHDVDGRAYLDFFAGAGALNYGHNHPHLKETLLDYFTSDRVVHSLDMFTPARDDFLATFHNEILKPRDLDYKMVFPGPGGSNAVEAALKLARKVTGRESVVNFTNAFHGMTLGALSVTGNAMKRGGAGLPLVHATPMPYDDYFNGDVPDFIYLEKLLGDGGGGLNEPAAVIVETVQGEGGLNTARAEWLRNLSELCKKHGVLLIVDDIQMGVGRTGSFFSFEEAGIVPDIVTLSKSLSGYGLPMAVTLIRPDLDIWSPGEHNGTFRGIGPAFATAAESIRHFWRDESLKQQTVARGLQVESRFNRIVAQYEEHQLVAKGRGMARGLQFANGELADQVTTTAFERGLLAETSGPEGEVLKLLPPLTMTKDEFERGMTILEESIDDVLAANPADKIEELATS
ncbi:diaminobutyrate--2-oxoglutarate transaminase [Sanguibacter sp. Z1732]|uniref:diaminobutyrate--2-oxoglutarate transaminase n=2 Tax=Micrococcales TaxID=85006 RepID=UPI003D9CB863